MIRVGIVGCGRVARHHLRFVAGMEDCQVMGLVDTDPKNAGSLARQFGIESCYSTLEELLDARSVDVIHILTPPQYHYAQAKMAIRHGVNVLIEKPMAFSAREVIDLYEDARAHGVSVCPDFIHLFNPCMLRAIELVNSGALGPVTHCESNWSVDIKTDMSDLLEGVGLPWAWTLPAGILHNYVTHPLYAVLYWVGAPKRVTVRPKSLNNLPQGLTDHLDILLEGERVNGYVTISFGTRPGLACVRLLCKKGSLVVNFETRSLLVERESKLPRTINRATASFRHAYQLFRNNIGNVLEGMQGKLVPFEGLRALIAAYYSSIRHRSDAPVSPALAVAVSEAEDAVTAQAGKVDLDLTGRPSQQPDVRWPERVMVTGASGYVGSEIVRQLALAGYYVRALVRPLSRTVELERTGVDITYGDLRDESSLEKALQGIDLVVHAGAGLRGSRNFIWESCVTGSKNIAKAAKAAGVKRVVYISSMSVYDFVALGKGAVITENSPLERFPAFRGPSSMAKRQAEDIALANLADPTTPWTILRPSVIFGNGRDIFFPLGAKLGSWLICFGSNRTHLRLIHVQDVAGAVLKTIQTHSTSGGLFVISHPDRVTVREYLKGCVEASRFRGTHVLPVPYYVASLGKLLLGIVRTVTGKGPRMHKQQLKYLYADVMVDSTAFTRQTGWQPSEGLLKQLLSEAQATWVATEERSSEVAAGVPTAQAQAPSL